MKKQLLILLACTIISLPAVSAQAQPITTSVSENNISESDEDNQVIVARATTAKTNQAAPMFTAPNTNPFLIIPTGKVVTVKNSNADSTFAEVTYLGHTGLVYKTHLTY